MRAPSVLLAFCLVLAGCGSSPAPSFSLAVTPATVAVQNDGAPQVITVGLNPQNGFGDAVKVVLSGLPAGVAASPAAATVQPGKLVQIALTASGATVGTPSTLTINGSSGSLTADGTASLTVTQALSNVSLSATAFDFGGSLVGSSLSRAVIKITNTGPAAVTLSPVLSGDASFALVPGQSCGASLDVAQSCSETVVYAPSAASGATPQTGSLDLGLGNVPAGTGHVVTLTGEAAALPKGTVTRTGNPLVALYTVVLPFPGTVAVHFGADTSYGRQTSAVTTTANGQTASILVAGMPQNTTYHLQGVVQLANGVTVTDTDQTFANGAATVPAQLTSTVTAGKTPQPGVEQMSLVGGTYGLVVSDLAGNVLWSYVPPDANAGYQVEGAKLLPNGHFLVTIGQGSSFALEGNPSPANLVRAIREIDLAGNIVREITIEDLNNELQAAGYNLTLQQFHHDVLPLANGHWIVLSNTFRFFDGLTGIPGTSAVLGDVVIDLDQNLQPVWVWNAFDHLDVNRHPMLFPDWTHANALLYSPTDGNLLLSLRHQNWIVKLDYNNGAGTGDVLWRLGEGGDFTLLGGTDPTDWFYAQHLPGFFTTTTAGLFTLGVMDNGDDRQFPPGVSCGQNGGPACLYTTVPVLQVNEGKKTATLMFHQDLDPSLYSYFGGNTELLGNGDIEYALAGIGTGSDIFEVTPDASAPQTVWHLHATNANAYRGYRIPSLYPGVQW